LLRFCLLSSLALALFFSCSLDALFLSGLLPLYAAKFFLFLLTLPTFRLQRFVPFCSFGTLLLLDLLMPHSLICKHPFALRLSGCLGSPPSLLIQPSGMRFRFVRLRSTWLSRASGI
jgi:hypothetical protein